jgi:hypothetical protein
MTAELLGIALMRVSRALKVVPQLSSGNKAITEAPSLFSAYNVVMRASQREKDRLLENVLKSPTSIALTPEAIISGEAPIPAAAVEVELPNGEAPVEEHSYLAPIRNESFHYFAKHYTGPRFNLLHCDFPYGINVSESAGQGSAKDMNEYEDTPEIYFNLLEALAHYQDSLIANSAHIIFWFSQNFRRETEDFFAAKMPSFTVQPFLMVWHKNDGNGLCPDPQRYGRRNLETALFLTRGDRKITKPKDLVFGFPGRNPSRIHKSLKPLPVVTHFLSMCVDDYSRVLDPTCGSGSALQSAVSLGASVENVVGLEIDTEMAATANREFNSFLEKGE